MKSMTGYGRANLEVEERSYQVEIKSVNHKYCDINIKMPKELLFLENEIKKEITQYVTRGKIDVYITFQEQGNSNTIIQFNPTAIEQYLQEMQKLSQYSQIDTKINVAELLKLPNVMQTQNEQLQEKVKEELLSCVNTATMRLVEMRSKEGKEIQKDLEKRILQLEEKQKEFYELTTGLIEDFVVKLRERVKEILQEQPIDETRIATEAVIYADKSSIEEELTRLKSHIEQAKQMLKEEKPVGKKMDFLIQEMNRETNTIGSKSMKLEITDLVITIKTMLEDIREQIQNIE